MNLGWPWKHTFACVCAGISRKVSHYREDPAAMQEGPSHGKSELSTCSHLVCYLNVDAMWPAASCFYHYAMPSLLSTAWEACSASRSSRVLVRSDRAAEGNLGQLLIWGKRLTRVCSCQVSLLFCLCSNSTVLIMIPLSSFSSSLETLLIPEAWSNENNDKSYLSLAKSAFLLWQHKASGFQV